MLRVGSHWSNAESDSDALGDQHLLTDAPAYALHRLRKAELIRLWRVAGMWKEEAEAAETASTGDDDDGLGKKELVDGLIAAVCLEHRARRMARIELTFDRDGPLHFV